MRLPSSLIDQALATWGQSFVPVTSQNNGLSPERIRLPFSLSPGPRNARFHVPP